MCITEPLATPVNTSRTRHCYGQVLREGTEEHVRCYVRASTLVEVWDELRLPRTCEPPGRPGCGAAGYRSRNGAHDPELALKSKSKDVGVGRWYAGWRRSS